MPLVPAAEETHAALRQDEGPRAEPGGGPDPEPGRGRRAGRGGGLLARGHRARGRLAERGGRTSHTEPTGREPTAAPQQPLAGGVLAQRQQRHGRVLQPLRGEAQHDAQLEVQEGVLGVPAVPQERGQGHGERPRRVRISAASQTSESRPTHTTHSGCFSFYGVTLRPSPKRLPGLDPDVLDGGRQGIGVQPALQPPLRAVLPRAHAPRLQLQQAGGGEYHHVVAAAQLQAPRQLVWRGGGK